MQIKVLQEEDLGCDIKGPSPYMVLVWLGFFCFLLTNLIGFIILPEEVVTSLIMKVIIAFNI